MKIINNIDNYLIGIAIGLRFRANFSIEDQLGKILDTILYSKKSFFSPKVFPKVRNSIGNKVLFNEYTLDKIHIDNSNIILEINFNEDGTFSKGDIPKILKAFEQDIIDNVVKAFKIKEIVRIGYIKRYLFKIDQLASSFVDKTIGNTIEGINDINLSFSKKFTTSAGLVKKDIFDYDNVIFNIIKKSSLDEIFMSIDFQRYFDPFLPNSNEIKFQTFITKVDEFNRKNYPEWINKNYSEAIDVK